MPERDFHDEIMGVSAPKIDLAQLGISRELAITLGPEATRDLVKGSLFRAISRALHPDVTDAEGATEAYQQISSAVTAVERLTQKEWEEVYRRFTARRDRSALQLSEAKDTIKRLREEVTQRDARVSELQEELAEHKARAAGSGGADLVMSLFMSAMKKPDNRLDPQGDNTVRVCDLLKCVITSGIGIHFVAHPYKVNTVMRDATPTDAELIAEQANLLASRKDRGIFSIDREPAYYTRVMGGYQGKTLSVGSSGKVVLSPEDAVKILYDTSSEISVGSNLLLATPASSGKGIPAGVEFHICGFVTGIYGPYRIQGHTVKGPHIP